MAILLLSALAALRVAAAFDIVSYVPDYRYGHVFKDKHIAGVAPILDEIILFSVSPDPSGRIEHAGRLPMRKRLRAARAINPSLRVTISVGGGGRSNAFAKAVKNRDRRRQMLIGTTDGGRKNGGLLGLCRRYKLDGVDFDWEAPRGPEEFRNYASLLREARIFLGRHGLTISVAIHPGAELGVSDLGESADFVHLMAYDFSGGNRGHSSFDDAVGAAKRLRDLAAVPSEKIRLGLPGYGANEAGETRTFAELSELYGADRAQLPDWARNVEDKIAWAKEAGLGGVFLWEVGHDILPLQPRSLLSRMSRAARGHRPPSRGEL